MANCTATAFAGQKLKAYTQLRKVQFACHTPILQLKAQREQRKAQCTEHVQGSIDIPKQVFPRVSVGAGRHRKTFDTA